MLYVPYEALRWAKIRCPRLVPTLCSDYQKFVNTIKHDHKSWSPHASLGLLIHTASSPGGPGDPRNWRLNFLMQCKSESSELVCCWWHPCFCSLNALLSWLYEPLKTGSILLLNKHHIFAEIPEIIEAVGEYPNTSLLILGFQRWIVLITAREHDHVYLVRYSREEV